MSNGLHAKRGFNYQDIVTLDLLLTHFGKHGASATVRPEGVDDLELSWRDSEGTILTQFVQVKKPREDRATNPTNLPWTLPDITRDLIPGAFAHLKGNCWQQDWVLGDNLSADALQLLDAGKYAPTQKPELYWSTVHLLARQATLSSRLLDPSTRKALMNWRLSPNCLSTTNSSMSHLTKDFGQELELRISVSMAETYRRNAVHFDRRLPDVLSRIHIRQNFGPVQEVSKRVENALQQRYHLDPDVVSTILFRNLRCYVNDISMVPGRRFNAEEFELELRTIWPNMMPVREPPPLDHRHIRRPDLSSRFTSHWSGTALEAIGISGAGKTMLAAEVYHQSRKENGSQPTFYVEIRLETQLRDVLIGIAFHLRRYGYTLPFSIAANLTTSTSANDIALEELTRSLGGGPSRFLLLLDMVDGSCSEAFCRDLRVFVKSSAETGCRLAVFGQESAFRHFSELDRQQLKIRSVDIRGFNYNEFRQLIEQNHEISDYTAVYDVFTAVTAGRSAGLYVRLARTLANTSTIAEMQELSRSSPIDMLQRAERQRFATLTEAAKSAAEKLVCLSLPFSRREVENIFPQERIALALSEMLELGLLRKTDDETFEMHETVRVGLENVVAIDVRRNIHSMLAQHYENEQNISAEIFHLEKAECEEKARQRARMAFLQGRNWPQLWGYVVAYRLVTISEVMTVVNSSPNIEGVYCLADVVAGVDGPDDAEFILDTIGSHLHRFGGDYIWSSTMAESYLILRPEGVDELYRLAFMLDGNGRTRADAISAILLASRRHRTEDPGKLVSLFTSLSSADRLALLPALLDNGSRDCLRRAFRLIEAHPRYEFGRHMPRWGFEFLRLENSNHVVEFLASIPDVDESRMLALQSPLLGRLATVVWANRRKLEEVCVCLLEGENTEQRVQKAAIRVMAFLGSVQLCDFCAELSQQTDNPIHGFAALAPLLVPGQIDVTRYEERLYNRGNSLPTRITALHVLAASGADLNVVYERVRELERLGESTALWELFFLQLASQYPFSAAISLLQARLSTSADRELSLFVGPVGALGSLAVEEATEMLVDAVSHPSAAIRVVAAMAFQERRVHKALGSLKNQLLDETDEEIQPLLAAAICASGPQSVQDVPVPSKENRNVERWQCIVALRTRDESFAEKLVILALDRSLHWQLRREAINAAGYFPYAVALKHMLPVLRERSGLLFDDHMSLYAHSFLSSLLEYEVGFVFRLFSAGRDEFVGHISEIFEEQAKELLDSALLPSSDSVGNWVYERLDAAGFPNDLGAIDSVINELREPLLFSAVIRSLRRVGRTDLIEEELSHCEKRWHAAKCIVECMRGGYRGKRDANSLRNSLSASCVTSDGRLSNMIEEIANTRAKVKEFGGSAKDGATLIPTVLEYEDAERLLVHGPGGHDLTEQSPVLLGELTTEQFVKLVDSADPKNDPERGKERYIPGIVLRSSGYSAATRQVSFSSDGITPRALIRPALVAANVRRKRIPWHEEMLSKRLSGEYAERVLRCISVAGNDRELFELLNRNSEIFILTCGSSSVCPHLADLIDSRVVPILASNASAGTDEMFESLARLAGLVESLEIDRVLGYLFKRWTGRFREAEAQEGDSLNHHFWRTFQALSGHPRFTYIKDWQRQLAPVLYSPRLVWYHRMDVVRVMERDQRSYIQLENIRSKSQDWEHFVEEDIDYLDEACERLFSDCTSEA